MLRIAYRARQWMRLAILHKLLPLLVSWSSCIVAQHSIVSILAMLSSEIAIMRFYRSALNIGPQQSVSDENIARIHGEYSQAVGIVTAHLRVFHMKRISSLHIEYMHVNHDIWTKHSIHSVGELWTCDKLCCNHLIEKNAYSKEFLSHLSPIKSYSMQRCFI